MTTDSLECSQLEIWNGYNHMLTNGSPFYSLDACGKRVKDLNISASLVIHVFYNCTSMCKLLLYFTTDLMPIETMSIGATKSIHQSVSDKYLPYTKPIYSHCNL